MFFNCQILRELKPPCSRKSGVQHTCPRTTETHASVGFPRLTEFFELPYDVNAPYQAMVSQIAASANLGITT